MAEERQTRSARRALINWLFWGGLFFLGTAVSAWLEWHSNESHTLAWFIAISLWSALCAIGYSLMDWLLKK